MIKVSLCFLLFLILSVGLAFSAFAASYSLYSSCSPSESAVVNLIGVWRNQSDYDPFDEYLVCRTGQYEYFLFYGPDLTSDYNYIRYFGTSSGYNTVWTVSFGSGSSLSVNYGNFLPVGNAVNSIASSTADTFKFQYVLVILACLVSMLLLFKFFRFRFNTSSSSKGWSYG